MQGSCTVAHALHRNAHLVQKRHMEVHERRIWRQPDVPPTLDRPRTPAQDKDREVGVRMSIAVADPAAIQDHRLIEERAIAVGGRTQSVKQMSEHLRVEDVDLRQFGEPLRIVAMVRHEVVRLGNTDLGIGPVAQFAADAVDDAGNTALHGAASQGEDTVVQFLVNQGAKLDVRNEYGETPWMIVAGFGLRRAGVNIDHPTTAELLRALGADTSH